MERYCGALQPAIRSRRFPYTSLNRYVLDRARLTHIKLLYGIQDALSLRTLPKEQGKIYLHCTSSMPSLITIPYSYLS